MGPGLPQDPAPSAGHPPPAHLVAVAARLLLGIQFLLSCCLFLFPRIDSSAFLFLISAEWQPVGYSCFLLCFSSFSDISIFLGPFAAVSGFLSQCLGLFHPSYSHSCPKSPNVPYSSTISLTDHVRSHQLLERPLRVYFLCTFDTVGW